MGRLLHITIQVHLANGIADLLKTYHPTVWNKLAGRLAELFFELSARERDR